MNSSNLKATALNDYSLRLERITRAPFVPGMPIKERTGKILNPSRSTLKRLATRMNLEEEEKYNIIMARSPFTWMQGLLKIRQSPTNKPSILIHRYK
ncbi:MAG: hypothetical protein HKN87_20965 [Saprospiraceae bacterium]|nr:hypothetical protein [Saprospiraceae bacterium]